MVASEASDEVSAGVGSCAAILVLSVLVKLQCAYTKVSSCDAHWRFRTSCSQPLARNHSYRSSFLPPCDVIGVDDAGVEKDASEISSMVLHSYVAPSRPN